MPSAQNRFLLFLDRYGLWISSFLGLFFLFSALAKALDMAAFFEQVAAYRIVQKAWLIRMAAFFALIAEGLLGAALLLRLWKGLPLLSLGLLAGFSLLLLYGHFGASVEDCGCFGKFLPMTPLQSLVKNILLCFPALALEILRLRQPHFFAYAPQKLALASGAVLGLALMGAGTAFSPQPVHPQLPPATKGPYSHYEISREGKPPLRLERGLYLVALMSDSCAECAALLPELNRLHKRENLPPVVGLMLGETASLERFRRENPIAFPHRLIPPLEFFERLQGETPGLVLIRDGQVLQYWEGRVPEGEELQAFQK